MKNFLLWGMLAFCGAIAWAEADPADRFLQAYFLIQEGDAAAQKHDEPVAQAKYAAALKQLQAIKQDVPDWNPHIIDFRLKYLAERVREVPAAPPVSPPALDAIMSAPPVPKSEELVQVANLTEELQKAQRRIQELESSREDLNGQLQKALAEVKPTETNLKIEELVEQNKKTADELAQAQQQIAELTQKAIESEKAQAQVKELEEKRNELSTQLQTALVKVESTEKDANTRVAELLEKNQALTEQLTTAQDELAKERARVTATEESPETQQLRTQLKEALDSLENTKKELAASREELAGVKMQLAKAEAANTDLRAAYAAANTRLDEAARVIAALQTSGEKNDEIILFLRKENALLKQIVDRREARLPRNKPKTNWLSKRKGTPEETATVAMKESSSGKLVAELSAPAVAAAEPVVTAPPKAEVPPRPEVPPAFTSSNEQTQRSLHEAQAAAAAKDLDTATAKYTVVLESEPDNLLALTNLGVMHYQRGKLDDAEQMLRRAVTLAPNDSTSRSVLGIVYFRKGKIEDAFAELTRAVQLDPRNAEAHNYLGITLTEKGYTAAAEQQIRKAIELNPQYADAHFNMAVLYANMKTPRLELAQHHYEKALGLGAARDATLDKLLKK